MDQLFGGFPNIHCLNSMPSPWPKNNDRDNKGFESWAMLKKHLFGTYNSKFIINKWVIPENVYKQEWGEVHHFVSNCMTK